MSFAREHAVAESKKKIPLSIAACPYTIAESGSQKLAVALSIARSLFSCHLYSIKESTEQRLKNSVSVESDKWTTAENEVKWSEEKSEGVKKERRKVTAVD
jgi:hypothetical protein